MSKKIIFLILAIIVIIPSMAYSVAVTQTTAEQVAMNWYSERNDNVPNDFSIVESFIEKENTENLFFIFNFDETGFVMVSADDITIPILGYVFKHNYTLENHPPQFDAMLVSFKEQIVYARENDISPTQEIQDEWERLNVRTENFERIRDLDRLGPLLSTIWNQGLYFNEMCPADGASTTGNGFVWAGCTATATAQVMKYHTHPTTGEGSHSYIPLTNPGYGLQSANFGATTYNWAAMPDTVIALNPSVQTLLYHVGVGVDMDYGPTGSSAWIGGVAWASALSALKDYFKYDLNAYHAWKNSYTVPVWDGMLHFELDNNRPLVYAGYNSSGTSGHAFVLDGYHSTTANFYHFNWGWGGWYDGYFFLTSLIPTAGYDYTYDQNALFLVEPRKWRPLPDVAIDVSLLPYTGVDLDHYYEGPVALLNYSVVTDLTGQEFALAINTNNELVFTENPTVNSDVNINITIRATYTGGAADDTFNFIITGTSSGSTTKWQQLPDLSPTGMDVDATFQPYDPQNPPLLLADDFLCTETGYITDIHIWGSWLDDHIPFFENPDSVQFTFSIHADIPAGGQPPWSMPGDTLWMKTWIPGPDDVEEIVSGPEDWYNPFLPMWLDDNHNLCYKYNYILDPADYFLQQGTPEQPIVYWLDVQAVPMDPDPACRFGWKTSLEHWNDDAVWIDAIEPYIGIWNELRYPLGHEFQTESIDLAFQITTEEEEEEFDFGDAPEGDGALAYPSLGIDGMFPTCITVGLANSYIQHGTGENLAWFGPLVDLETDGNAGNCPGCFSTYDDDECFNDGDAGLLFPDSYTIDASDTVIPCPNSTAGSSLGNICTYATWGTDIDIDVTNNMLVDGYINVLFDWNQDGQWHNDMNTQCAGITVHEYVVLDLGIQAGYSGTLSGLLPTGSTFQIGPNAGYVWVRFSITDVMIGLNDWDGSGVFDDGESEDYLLYIKDEEPEEELDFGDAPEGEMKIAYPSTGMLGYFPTCITVGPSGYVSHGPGPLSAFFGPAVDLEVDGNAGLCPGCFPTYDDDECFQDGDAGLIIPEPFTINTTNTVVPCTGFLGTPLGTICQTANWGVDIDIDVQNLSTMDLFVNVLFDWNQNGYWLDDPGTTCLGTMTPEHVLINFVVPAGYTGPLSGLTPPSFVIGPNAGYFWSRFTISDTQVPAGEWNGEGEFAEGETEDYLILVEEEPVEFDFGDAPDPTYPTLLAVGARHILDGVTYLGAQIDAEPDGQPDATATGDDNDGNDDEDGVLFVCPLIPGEQGAVYVQASTNGLLNAWLDFDGSGSWDASEQIFTDSSLIPGWNSLNFSVPTSAIPGITFARFRFDTNGGLGVTGSASDGEVEDYQVEIEENLHDGLKMHYHQWPDTTSFGVDVNATQYPDFFRIIADDFLCVETGPINSIHFWGSWKNDMHFDNTIFDLRIWSDNPVWPSGWSEPLTLLWQRQFIPGEYDEAIYYETPNGEWWYDPCTGEFVFPGDYTVWEYHFIIPDADAFMQEEDTIYWLSVTAIIEVPGIEFGWKSSVNHWYDDAVYQCIPTDPWTELIYPFGHPFNPEGIYHVSMDMAFYIDCHPSNPVNFTISKVGTNITLQWDPVLCASYYNVYSSTDPYATFPTGWTLEALHITTTTWSEPVSGAGSKKFYRVTAEN